LKKHYGIAILIYIEKVISPLKSVLRKLIIDDENYLVNREEVMYWKNRIYYITASILLIFGAPLMFYGAYIYYRTGYTEYAIIEVCLYIINACIVINKNVTMAIKKYYISYSIYMISIFLLLTTGLMGGGLVCVIFSMILMGCLLNKKQIVWSVIINLMVFLIITMILYSGGFDGTYMEGYKTVWLINVGTAQSCGIMLLIVINTIYIGLEKQAQRIKKSETLLAASEIKHKSMIANISDVIVIIDKDGHVTYYSPNLTKRFPVMAKNIMEGTFYDNLHPKDRKHIENLIRSILSENGKQRTMEARYFNKNNEIRYMELTAVNLMGDININGILINYCDITKRKVREREILYLNQHDSLTGLYNRAHYELQKKYLDMEEQLPFSIIVGDINGLKIINDALGHLEGDKLLVKISKIIMECCKATDVVARVGGDEFTILLPKTTNEEAIKIIDDINAKCNEYNSKIERDLYHLSISLGSSTKYSIQESLDTIQKNAEDFMYKRKLLEGRSFHSSIISSIKTALFEKSHETEQHAGRLIELTKEIGKAVGLSNQQYDELELFSTLHDIGKIGIDNQILNKPAKLTEEEWVIMRKHSEIGYRIAMASPELMSIAYYILTHHERWDGSGYPQGLKGENIPKLSRILALADAYDAMTEDRPYRKGMPKQEAIDEIIRNIGTQFDPELAEIFIKIVISKDELHES